jgi:hypothetical protein
MWQKRAFGQLAKCTEAQVLRMAFPEFSGGQPTAEEMEGKTTLEGVAEPPARSVHRPEVVVTHEPAEPPKTQRTLGQFLDALEIELREAQTWDEVSAIAGRADVVRAQEVAKNGLAQRLSDMLDAARERTMHETVGDEMTV